MHKLFFRETGSRLIDATMKTYVRSISFLEEDNWYYDRHSHSDLAEFMFVEQGCALYFIDNVEYRIEQGDIAIINSGIVHSESTIGGTSLKLWVCSLHGLSFFGMRMDQLIPPDIRPIIKSGDQYDFFLTRFKSIFEEKTKQRLPYSDEICQFIFAEIIIVLYRLIEKSGSNVLTRNDYVLVNQICEYIDENFEKPITLETLEEKFFASTSYIVHEMTRIIHASPINYLISRRIGEAQRLLLATNYAVSVISRMVGYSNIHYFSQLFTKRVGVSPTEFRNACTVNR